MLPLLQWRILVAWSYRPSDRLLGWAFTYYVRFQASSNGYTVQQKLVWRDWRERHRSRKRSTVKPADGGRSVDGSPFSYIKSGQLSTLGWNQRATAQIFYNIAYFRHPTSFISKLLGHHCTKRKIHVRILFHKSLRPCLRNVSRKNVKNQLASLQRYHL